VKKASEKLINLRILTAISIPEKTSFGIADVCINYLQDRLGYSKQSHSLLLSCANVMDRSLIWSALGRMSKQGLLPIPIEDISASLTSAMNNNDVSKLY